MLLENGYHDVPLGKTAAVAYFLEMTAPPAPRPMPPSAGLVARRVAAPDLAWYRDLMRRTGAEWLWFSRLLLSDEELAAIIHDPTVTLWTIEQDGLAKGMAEIDASDPSDIELHFFGVTADLVGTGAGRILMDLATKEVWARRPRRFWLHTCTLDHPAALAFYIRSGFRPYRLAVEIRDDPRVDGTLPETVASRVPLLRPSSLSRPDVTLASTVGPGTVIDGDVGAAGLEEP